MLLTHVICSLFLSFVSCQSNVVASANAKPSPAPPSMSFTCANPPSFGGQNGSATTAPSTGFGQQGGSTPSNASNGFLFGGGDAPVDTPSNASNGFLFGGGDAPVDSANSGLPSVGSTATISSVGSSNAVGRTKPTASSNRGFPPFVASTVCTTGNPFANVELKPPPSNGFQVWRHAK